MTKEKTMESILTPWYFFRKGAVEGRYESDFINTKSINERTVNKSEAIGNTPFR